MIEWAENASVAQLAEYEEENPPYSRPWLNHSQRCACEECSPGFRAGMRDGLLWNERYPKKTVMPGAVVEWSDDIMLLDFIENIEGPESPEPEPDYMTVWATEIVIYQLCDYLKVMVRFWSARAEGAERSSAWKSTRNYNAWGRAW